MTDVRIRRYPFAQPLCAEDLDLREEKALQPKTRTALAKLRLRIQHVYGCSDRKAYIDRNFVDVEVNPNHLGSQVEGGPTPQQRFDLGVQDAIRLGWEDELFPDAANADTESIEFSEPFFVDEKGQDLDAEPETVEEPTDDAVTIEIDPNDSLSNEEILELLAFWRRITESTRTVLLRANINNEVSADELYHGIELLMTDYKKLCDSGREWSWSELQYELAGHAELFRYIAGVLRNIDGYADTITPGPLLLLRLVYISSNIPLPLTVVDTGIMLHPTNNRPTEPTVPHQRSQIEDGTDDSGDGASNT